VEEYSDELLEDSLNSKFQKEKIENNERNEKNLKNERNN